MKIFKDADGGEWSFEWNVYEFKRLRGAFGDLLDPEYFLLKTSDAVFLVDVLFALVGADAERRGIDAAAFARKFKGDAVDAARRALIDEYVDFFPSRSRERMREALAKVEAIAEAAGVQALKQLDDDAKKAAETVDATAESVAPEARSAIPSDDNASNSPESSASTKTAERSGNFAPRSSLANGPNGLAPRAS